MSIQKFNCDGYNSEGYDHEGFDANGLHRDGVLRKEGDAPSVTIDEPFDEREQKD